MPTIDTQASGVINLASSGSVSLTSVPPNDLIIVFVAIVSSGNTLGAPPTVSSVSDSNSRTWTSRKTFTGNNVRVEEWYAISSPSGTLNYTITVNLSASGTATIIAFAVGGANISSPFDTNTSLPATATGTASPLTVNINTSNANDMIIGLGAAGEPGVAGSVILTVGTGYTQIANLASSAGKVSNKQQNNVNGAAEYLIVSTTQTNLAVNFTESTNRPWALIADAIQTPTPVSASASVSSTVSGIASSLANGVLSILTSASILASSVASGLMGISSSAANVASGVINSIASVSASVSSFIISQIASGVSNILSSADIIAFSVAGAVASLTASASSLVSLVANGVVSILSSASSVASSVASAVASIVASASNIASSVASAIASIVASASNIMGGIVNAIASIVASASNIASSVIGATTSIVASAGNITGGIVNAVSSIVATVSSVASSVASAVASIVASSSNIISEIANATASIVASSTNIASSLVNAIASISSSSARIASSIVNAFLSMATIVNNIASSIVGAITSIVSSASSVIDPTVFHYCVPTDPALKVGLAIYWKFSEGTGNMAFDYSGNMNHGILINSPTWVSGVAGDALQFVAASSQYVQVNLNNLQASQLTIAGWYKSTSTTGTIFSITTNTASGSAPQISVGLNTGKLTANLYTSISNTLSDSTTSNDGNWHHFVLSFDGTTANLYRDGNLVSALSLSYSYPAWQQARIGWDEGQGFGFYDGVEDDVRFYSRILSVTEVQELYQGG